MNREYASIRTKQFVTELNTGSIAYEVKRTRATWDATLSIPGTDRRGGWRCPPGTRYGGQITDRFGRNCGWGVSRRLANEISDLGERMENIGEGRRARRVERQAARRAERVARPGLVERAAGRVANALETDTGSRQVEAPKAPRNAAPARPRAPRARRGNLRNSEERRMQREIVNPDAPRTGEVDRPQPARRPRPVQPRARRREATAGTTRNRPVPAQRGEFDNVGDVQRIIDDREFANYDDEKLSKLREAAQGFNDRGDTIAENHMNILDAEIARRRQPAKKKAPAKKAPAKKKAVKKKAPAKKAAARRVTPAAGGNDAEPPRMTAQRPATATPRVEIPNQPEEQAPEPIDGLSRVFAGRRIGFERNWEQERDRLRNDRPNFANMNEQSVRSRIDEVNTNLAWNQEYLRNLEALPDSQPIRMRNNKVVNAGELRPRVAAVVAEWERLQRDANLRLNEINANRLPGSHSFRALNNQNLNGHANIADAEAEMDRLINDYAADKFNLIAHNNKFYVLSQNQLVAARNGGLDNPEIRASRGGLPLANDLPDIDPEVARQAEKRVNDAIQKRQRILADYLNQRYGEGNAPWREMTPEKMARLQAAARNGDSAAKTQLRAWAKQMYSHEKIEGTNGKTYRTVVKRVTFNGSEISVQVDIERQNGDTWTRVGGSARTIMWNNRPPKVYNNSMFIDSDADKNSGIQTIYNQHAFMYAKAAGFKQFGVSAVQDGRFVWGKVGFKQQIDPLPIARMNNEVAKFRAGKPSLIKNDSDARIVDHLVQQFIRNPNNVRHLDFVSAISNTETSKAAKKTRDDEIKSWFSVNMPFSGGIFDLDDNKILPDPRERN